MFLLEMVLFQNFLEKFKMKQFVFIGVFLLSVACFGTLTFSMVGVPPGYVNVKEYGAVGDGVTDDTVAIRSALQVCKKVYFPAGVYVLTNGFELSQSIIIMGAGTPALAPFPLRDDDKRFLRSGSVPNLPGTVLLFRGTGQAVLHTVRQDTFSSMRYALKTHPNSPFFISDLAIVLDVQVFNEEGLLTTPEDDQSADYDVGLLIDNSSAGTVQNVAVFGYWNKAGLCVVSRGDTIIPDCNTFWNCSFMGDRGVALVGSGSVLGPKLSSTRFYGCDIFAGDHHKRGTAWGTTALYIDGIAETSSVISGHSFYGGCVRTYLNQAVKLDHVSHVAFFGTVFELPPWNSGGVELVRVNDSGCVVGTADTKDISFVSCRHRGLGFSKLAQVMTNGNMFVVNDNHHTVACYGDGKAVRIMAIPGLDPVLQLTDDTESSNSGWTIRMDVSERNILNVRYNNASKYSILTGELD
ncbi:glycosyl hydrolase family 28-related protein [Tichowtungia aerotolerans]|uniref:Rhamnogalacturonase A/B/Epimerase-like pectate lyase domain-containing protein n=1 Tax=Tichowtungia aerotolerans TaxID=2697043 RepID=A0A6P1M7Z1_9BACT|nr:glycosyl hydrolase family 28-related protein [Tichowtungia aerotolerans]QHI70162.1 hypothetical protein GT409_12135 [Tichowtungia aerotolerans]